MMLPEDISLEHQSVPQDTLDNLPDNVIDFILMCLPLRDAVRTSILSKKWRYSWCSLPQLTLDQTLWKPKRNLTNVTIIFTNIIYHILTLHVGSITKFTLSIPRLRACPNIDNFFYFLSKNGIQHLVLELPYHDTYKLPSSIFTCLHLRHLNLQKCIIPRPPSDFKGFDRLINLELCQVTISSNFFGSSVTHSPLLENLVLVDLNIKNPIEIDAPKLRSLVFTGYLHNIRLRSVPLLAKVSIMFEPTNVMKARKHDLTNFFESIPSLEYLLWKCNLLQYLIDKADKVPKRLSSDLNCLKHLHMKFIRLDELHSLQSVLCLIKSSPYLQNVEIEVYRHLSFNQCPDPDKLLDPAIRKYVDEIPANFSDMTLKHLKEVKFKRIAGTRPEMQLIKLLLIKSPSLIRIVVEPYHGLEDEKSLEVVAEIAKFQLASSNAKVIYNVA